MASAGEHHSSSADFPPGTGRHSSPLHLSHSFGGCTNTTVKLQDRILLTQPPLSHRLSFPSNCTRENSLLSLGSNSILSFKPTSECSSINSSMILSFDRDLIGDPKSRKERETRKSSQGSQADQEMYCNEISGCYEQVAESVKERQREEEMGWFCSEDIVGGDGDSQKRPNSGSEGVGSKRHCASNHYKSKSRLTISKDPQSIAAKNRRERISERLRTLQDLVPNGTKVDLVTMLEKAISYVKFLQLQVKVLATDEFWPPHGGKAAELGQVKEAIEAILSSHMQSHS